MFTHHGTLSRQSMGFMVGHSGNFFSEDHSSPRVFALFFFFFLFFFLLLPPRRLAGGQSIRNLKHAGWGKGCGAPRTLGPDSQGPARTISFIRHAAGLAALRVLWPYHV